MPFDLFSQSLEILIDNVLGHCPFFAPYSLYDLFSGKGPSGADRHRLAVISGQRRRTPGLSTMGGMPVLQGRVKNSGAALLSGFIILSEYIRLNSQMAYLGRPFQ